MTDDAHKVTLNVYDLSQGLARQLSTTFLGKPIDGIWHTGVVVYGNEYFYGGGVQHVPGGTTQYGTPIKVIDLGFTYVPKELFEEYLQEISPRYTAETYSLLKHNCNNFSNEVSQFLVGMDIPEYILQLPNEVVSSPMGSLIMPMIQQFESTLRAGGVPQVNDKAVVLDSGKSSDGLPKKEVVKDPLGDARLKVQEEMTREFAEIMASENVGASEAATMATRRVMERYGRIR